MNDNNYTLEDLVNELWGNRKKILIICAIAFLLSAIIAFMIPNKFQARTTFYAASEDLNRPEVVFGKNGQKIYYYGNRKERDRVIAVAKSRQMLDSLAKYVPIYEHYDIDEDKASARVKLSQRFQEHFEIRKNDLDALIIRFIDEDPEFAAQVTNLFRDKLDEAVTGILKSSQKLQLASIKKRITYDEKRLADLQKDLEAVQQKYNVYDGKVEFKAASIQKARSQQNLKVLEARLKYYLTDRGTPRDTIRNIRVNIEGTKAILKTFNDDEAEGSTPSISKIVAARPKLAVLDGLIATTQSQLYFDQGYAELLEVAMTTSSPSLHVIEEAEVPRLRHSPKRKIIVLAATMVAFVLATLTILFFAALRGFRSNK